MKSPHKILVTGATGYVGGRLVPYLLEKGYHVKAISRSLKKLEGRSWAKHHHVELCEVDVLDKDALCKAMEDCTAAYYLVHSMLPGEKKFRETDKDAAMVFRDASRTSPLKRIIYLGGLGANNEKLSEHLQSRQEVAHILSEGPVPTTLLRAALIIGSGSASFEILRYLVDRLPLMTAPRWINTLSQPIAIRNVIHYLLGCLEHDETNGKTYDIGGPDVLSYRKLMEIYAEEAHLRKRIIVPLPFLSPRLSSYWIHLVTPVPASIAKPLVEGLRNKVVCKNKDIEAIIPQHLLSCQDAISRALERTKTNTIMSHWTDAGKIPPFEWGYEGDPQWTGGTLLTDRRVIEIPVSSSKVWKVITKLGGKNGWYHGNWLWSVRGFIDRLFGGVGLKRGRRESEIILPGDAVDFWRAVQVDPSKKLVLVAEMKLPGQASLEFKLSSPGKDRCILTQTAKFKPKGLMGLLYWYSILPLHHYVFGGMQKKIAKLAVYGTAPKKAFSLYL